MMERLRHRGPDDFGYAAYSKGEVHLGRDGVGCVINPEVVLFHRRLSILDLSETGWQPMGTSDERYFIVYNGEIYNYVELRAELEDLGYRFKSRSDTEVLLLAYSCWGLEAFTRFTGMFALAILDTQERKLILARDCFGIKPLYYTWGSESFVFASELKVLLEANLVRKRINPTRLYEYLRYGISDYGSDTLLSGVFQVPSGHYVEISLEGPLQARTVCYWEPGEAERLDISFDDAAKHLRDLFLKNIRLHLRSDVPVGAALSGGIDSSSIVMGMRHLETKLDLHAFSYVAHDESLSEEKWIDVVGKASGAHVHKVRVNSDNLREDFDSLVDSQDEPFGSTSIYAQYCVFREAQRNGIKVMLDGQGADEILGGYRSYMAARLASLVRQNHWQQATEFLLSCSRLPNNNKFSLIMRAADYLFPPFASKPLRRAVGKDVAPTWVNKAWFCSHGVEPKSFNHSHTTDILRESLWKDLTKTSLPALLRYEDRNSMAFSIESRVPFLTPDLVNFVLSLPEEYLIHSDGTAKAVFRAAMRGIVPDCILNRRDKIGFQTPEHRWLTCLASWVQNVLNGTPSDRIPALNLEQVKCDWHDMRQRPERFDSRAWRWVNLIQWTNRFDVSYD